MRQWEDDTLVATKITESGKFKVIELPARETEVITSRRTFGTIAKAEAYMLDQYPTATVVFPSDIEAEVEIRKAPREVVRLLAHQAGNLERPTGCATRL